MIAVAQARHLLAHHHGGGGPVPDTSHPSMARGRWNQDSDGWHSRSSSRGRTSNKRWNNRRSDDADRLRDENKRLQQQLRDARAQSQRADAKSDDGAHPNAKEGPARHGDWQCISCLFATNRYSRERCYRCAAAKSLSFRQALHNSPASPAGLAAGTAAPTTSISVSSAIASTSPSASTTAAWTPASTSPTMPVAPCTSGQPPPLLQQGSPTQPTSVVSNGGSGPGQPALVGPEGIKALKSQLDKLLAAKAHIANDPLLGHVAAGLEAQIQGVRTQLSCAQPLEVALRGTLGAVASARQALSRAEQKAAKLESQVVSAVAAYELAAAEVQSCQKTLADAEAATARTAGGRFDPRLLMGSHPGAALAILSEAASARCIVGAAGVDAQLAERVQAAFTEVQAVCRLLPAEVPTQPQPTPPTTGSGAAGASPPSFTTVQSDLQMGEGASRGIAGHAHGIAPSDDTAANGETSAQAVHAAQLQLHHHLPNQALIDHHQQQLQQQQAQAQAQQQLAAQQQAQAAAAELAKQHAQAALAQAAQQAALQAAGSAEPSHHDAAPGSAEDAIAAAAPPMPTDQTLCAGTPESVAARAAAVPAGPRDDSELCNGSPSAHGGPPPRDDTMGGGASDGIVNKRTASESVDAARAIAAKAKARAGSN